MLCTQKLFLTFRAIFLPIFCKKKSFWQRFTCTVTYEAQVMGPQTIVINLDDAEVPQSPIKLDIKPAADLSKIALIDFEPEAFVDCPNDFIVDTSGQHL